MSGDVPTASLAWPAWAGVIACAVFAIGTGLEWIGLGEASADGFDVPFGALVSDGATGGLALGIVLVVVAAIGPAVALLAPDPRPVSSGLLVAGGSGLVLVVWYVVRAVTSTTAPGATLLSYGVWIALGGAAAAALSGVLLRSSARGR